jgi:hypothetical protein
MKQGTEAKKTEHHTPVVNTVHKGRRSVVVDIGSF